MKTHAAIASLRAIGKQRIRRKSCRCVACWWAARANKYARHIQVVEWQRSLRGVPEGLSLGRAHRRVFPLLATLHFRQRARPLIRCFHMFWRFKCFGHAMIASSTSQRHRLAKQTHRWQISPARLRRESIFRHHVSHQLICYSGPQQNPSGKTPCVRLRVAWSLYVFPQNKLSYFTRGGHAAAI